MSVVERHMVLTGSTIVAEGSTLRVRVELQDPSSSASTVDGYAGDPARVGVWLHGFLASVMPADGWKRRTAVKVRMVDGVITGFRHAVEPRPWFDPRSEDEGRQVSARRSRVDQAAEFINRRRIGVQAPLTQRPNGGWSSRAWPNEVWSDDDVVTHAREQGWSG